MAAFTVTINSKIYQIEADSDMPLLWVLRDVVGLKGTKYGCGIGLCGACTVHSNGKPIRSCQTPIKSVTNSNITTIEGLELTALHPVQEAWIELQVPQCGYCQSGQIMSAVGLLSKNPQPNEDEVDAAMSGNLCRCGTYDRVKKAIKIAADKINEAKYESKK